MSTVAADINGLSTDRLNHILILLPLPSPLRSTSVCKLWRSVILSSAAATASSGSAWFFLLGVHNASSRNHQSFAFEPVSSAWHLLPSPPASPSSVSADSDHPSPLLFSITTPLFSFSTPFRPPRPSSVPPLHFPQINPLVAAIGPRRSFVVVGGVKFIGNLVDIEDDRLPVEIFNSNSWQLRDPLPPESRPANSSFSLSSALFRRRLHVFSISNHLLSSFDLDTRSWSPTIPLRPPGLQSGFLISCRDKLLLAGLSNAAAGDPSFNLWEIRDGHGATGFLQIASMPGELLEWLVEGSGEDENKYASIKCVGTGDLVYVFNEEYYRKYPACVCYVGKGEWRRLPELSSPFNKFHKVITFSSEVSVRSILR